MICFVTDCWETVTSSAERCDECIRYFEKNNIVLHDVMSNWNGEERDVLNAVAFKKSVRGNFDKMCEGIQLPKND